MGTIIHNYEAILATLAIGVWHFYSVIFDPDRYPMEWTWITGKTDAGNGGNTGRPPRLINYHRKTSRNQSEAISVFPQPR